MLMQAVAAGSGTLKEATQKELVASWEQAANEGESLPVRPKATPQQMLAFAMGAGVKVRVQSGSQ